MLCLACGLSHGQVVLDGSQGASGPLAGPDYQIDAQLGRQVGGNLFHSFATFNLDTGESATFSGPETVERVVGRVTGGNPSRIDGTLRSTIPGADLYLMNPNGVLFGENARLEVDGAFWATTADYLTLGETRFEATVGEGELSTAPVSAFGFVRAQPLEIAVEDSALTAGEGQTLGLVGGALGLGGAQLEAPGGAIHLVAVASPGEVIADGQRWRLSGATGGAVDARDSTVTVSGERAGLISLHGQSLSLANTALRADTIGGEGEGVTLDLETEVRLSDASQISANTRGAGRGGSVRVDTQVLTIDGSASERGATGLFADSLAEATGRGGAVVVNARDIDVIDGEISASSDGVGDGGEMRISAQRLTIDGRELGPPFSFFSLLTVNANGTGNGGTMSLDVGELTLLSGGGLTANANDGSGGEIVIDSDAINIDGGGLVTQIIIPAGASVSTRGAGQGGNLTVRAATIEIVDGGGFLAAASGTGDAGRIVIEAQDLLIDGAGTETGTAVATISTGNGRGGDVAVTASDILIRDGGSILTDSFGDSGSGDLAISADRITIDGAGTEFITGLSVGTFPDSQGPAGSLTLAVGELTVIDGGAVNASARGDGPAGRVVIDAGRIVIDGSGSDAATLLGSATTNGAGGLATIRADAIQIIDGGISTQTDGRGDAGQLEIVANTIDLQRGGSIASSTSGSGRGGDLQIRANQINLDGGVIGVDANPENVVLLPDAPDAERLGDAGDLTIVAEESLTLDNGSQLLAQADTSGGGSIAVVAPSVRLDNNSQVSASVFEGAEGGGNIAISADTLIAFDDSDIIARADQGLGGNIAIDAELFLRSPDVDLDASSNVLGNEGSVEVDAVELDISPALLELAAIYLRQQELSDRCGTRGVDAASSFALLGRGGVIADAAPQLLTQSSDLTSPLAVARSTLSIPPEKGYALAALETLARGSDASLGCL
ncbi:MAG: filamentous hemagglutinin N-terminal domain-containing protein [Candidatus Competibacterales bacterium]